MTRSPRRRLLGRIGAVAVAVGLALVGAHAAGLLLDDSARPASVGDAVQRYRNASREQRAVAGVHPLAGVYQYATRGSESIDALGGARHRYPRVTALIVRSVPCGVSLRWQPLEERATTWTLCLHGSRLELRGIDQLHRFFGQDDHTAYACRDGLLGRRAAGFTCRTGAGRETFSLRELPARVIVAGRSVRARHLRLLARVGGSNRGTELVEWWLDGRGLPLRLVLRSRTSRHVFLSTVHYREDAELRLLSRSPRR